MTQHSARSIGFKHSLVTMFVQRIETGLFRQFMNDQPNFFCTCWMLWLQQSFWKPTLNTHMQTSQFKSSDANLWLNI